MKLFEKQHFELSQSINIMRQKYLERIKIQIVKDSLKEIIKIKRKAQI